MVRDVERFLKFHFQRDSRVFENRKGVFCDRKMNGIYSVRHISKLTLMSNDQNAQEDEDRRSPERQLAKTTTSASSDSNLPI